jgi:hypothetical protein
VKQVAKNKANEIEKEVEDAESKIISSDMVDQAKNMAKINPDELIKDAENKLVPTEMKE